MEKLNELKEAFYPQYGTPGCRDMDVTARRKVIDENIEAVAEALRALESEVAELRREKQNDNRYQELLKLGKAVVYECDAAVQRAEVAEAKLAELEKQEPIDFRWRWASDENAVWTYCHMDRLPDAVAAFGDNVTFELVYNRPACAADLADLLPPKKELVSDTKNLQACEWGFHLQDEGWNKCIDAILHKIEEAK